MKQMACLVRRCITSGLMRACIARASYKSYKNLPRYFECKAIELACEIELTITSGYWGRANLRLQSKNWWPPTSGWTLEPSYWCRQAGKSQNAILLSCMSTQKICLARPVQLTPQIDSIRVTA